MPSTCLGVASGDDDANWIDPGVNKHVEYRPPDPGEIDHKFRVARQLSQQLADMGDDARVGRTERHALEVPKKIGGGKAIIE